MQKQSEKWQHLGPKPPIYTPMLPHQSHHLFFFHLKPSVNWVDLVVQVINGPSKQKIDHSFEKCTHTAAHSANQRESAAGKAVDKLK